MDQLTLEPPITPGDQVRRQRVPSADLLDAYAELGNVHRVGERFGIHGSSVHERLRRLGVDTSDRDRFRPDEIARIKRDYVLYRDQGRVSDLARLMGRSVSSICRIAGKFGLTQQARPKPFTARWKYLTEEETALLLDDFKRSSLGLGQYLAKRGWPDDGFRAAVQRYFPDEWDAVIESKAPRQSPYRLGRAVEYRVRDHLASLGWFVLRSPASKSPLDLVGVRPGTVLFVQVKRSLALGPGEWNEIYELALGAGALPILAGSPTGRGLSYFLLTGPKDGSKRRQPLTPWDPSAGLGT